MAIFKFKILMEWSENHFISVCGIYLKNPVVPTEILSSRRSEQMVKERHTLQPLVLSSVVGPGDELCRVLWPVSMYLPPTPTPFKETTT